MLGAGLRDTRPSMEDTSRNAVQSLHGSSCHCDSHAVSLSVTDNVSPVFEIDLNGARPFNIAQAHGPKAGL